MKSRVAATSPRLLRVGEGRSLGLGLVAISYDSLAAGVGRALARAVTCSAGRVVGRLGDAAGAAAARVSATRCSSRAGCTASRSAPSSKHRYEPSSPHRSTGFAGGGCRNAGTSAPIRRRRHRPKSSKHNTGVNAASAVSATRASASHTRCARSGRRRSHSTTPRPGTRPSIAATIPTSATGLSSPGLVTTRSQIHTPAVT